MKPKSFLATALLVAFFSCHPKSQNLPDESASEVAAELEPYSSFLLGYRESYRVQDGFFLLSVDALRKVETDDHASVDTVVLETMLDSARALTERHLMDSSGVVELAPDIALRQKIIRSDELFLSAYSSAFVPFVQLLGSGEDHKFDKASLLLKEVMVSIRDAHDEEVAADSAFGRKFHFRAY